MLQRLRDHVLDLFGFAVLIIVGALLTAMLFLLRIIPDRDRERAEAARKAAEARIAAIRAKIVAAKAERDAEMAAQRADITAKGESVKAQPAVQTANEYITGKR